jgi:hypothetical protein
MAQEVTPWDVQAGSDGKIDYDKLVRKFGCQMIDQALIDRCDTPLRPRRSPLALFGWHVQPPIPLDAQGRRRTATDRDVWCVVRAAWRS